MNLADYVLKYVNQTNQSVFLTGKAGTGKTTLLKEILGKTHKNSVVVAPTGIAALNAGGVTIHSMFQLPFASFIPSETDSAYFSENLKFETRQTLFRHFRMNSTRLSVIRNLELLIIDEVSMLRADLLDAIDFMLQRVRRNTAPFGGVQVLFIGDLLQLPPIVRNEEWQVLKKYYQSPFFFESWVIKSHPPIYIELEKVYRQENEDFIKILNHLRNNTVENSDINTLNKYYRPDFNPKDFPGYITLTTHNAKADNLNNAALDELKGVEFVIKPEIEGDFPERIYPIDSDLRLKVGAQVMFIKNDISPEKRFYNGKIGMVESLEEGEVNVRFLDNKEVIKVDKYEWNNIRYTINESSKDVSEEVLGTYVQYPLKLAWAITVHKSQGLTFEKAILDVSESFAPGQTYVALSRLRSLDGLVLLKKIPTELIPADQNVADYAKNKSGEDELENKLQSESQKYLVSQLLKSFDFDVLIQLWRNHKFSYDSELPNSPKRKFQTWINEVFAVLQEIEDPSKKFRRLLQSITSTNEIDTAYLKERTLKAFDYFAEKISAAHLELLLKMEEVSRIKRMKEFYRELEELDNICTEKMKALLRSEIWLKAVIEKSEINKELFANKEILSYKTTISKQAKDKFKESHLILGEEKYYSREKKKKKKKQTTEETFELWQEYKSVEKVAEVRKLSQGTIYGHLLKLLILGRVSSIEILEENEHREIREVLLENSEKSNTEIYEMLNQKYSFDLIRLVRADLEA